MRLTQILLMQCLLAAQQNQSPVIINVAEVHLTYIDLESTAEYIKKKLC